MSRKQSTLQRRAKRDAKQRSAARNMIGKRNAETEQTTESPDAEGGGGFNPRKKPAKSMRALAPESPDVLKGHDFSRAVSRLESPRALAPEECFKVAAAKMKTAAAAEPQLVEIEKPIYGGSFLARVAGKAVFVPLALPGEQVRVRITQSKSGYATAETEEIVRAAPERIAAACPHFGLCGGCHYQHTDYANPTGLQTGHSARNTGARRRGCARGNRRTLRRAVALSQSHPPGLRCGRKPGLSGSQIPRSCAGARVPHRRSVAGRGCTGFCSSYARSCPGAATHGDGAFLQCRRNRAAGHRLHRPAPRKLHFDELAQALQETHSRAHRRGVGLSRDVPASSRARLAQWGAASLTYRAAGFDYRVDHGAFFQVNRWLVDSLVERVVAQPQRQAGLGSFCRRGPVRAATHGAV